MSKEDKFVKHTNCDECGSSDGNAVYESGSSHCFVCNNSTPSGSENVDKESKVIKEGWESGYIGSYSRLEDRNIKESTLKKYGVKVEKDYTGDIIKHHYPYFNKDNNLSGFKTRTVKDKKFFGSGDTSSNNMLFGQQLFRTNGRYVTVVEGELDALATYEMLGGTWTVVSVNNGAKCLDNIKANLEWLDSYETVVLCFDNDEDGREATKSIAPILGPNKCKIVSLSEYKDASDYLVNNASKKFVEEWWDAKPYVVSGVATLDDMYQALLEYKHTELIPLPESFGNLNEMTRGGLARGELTSIIAHTSIGKTTIINELLYHFATETKEKVGCFMVEDSLDETVRKVVSVHTNKNLSLLAPKELEVDEIMELAKDLGFGSKIQLHNDGGGSIDLDEMFSKIRYFVKGLGCSIIIVDPLHTAIKNLSNENIEEVCDRFIKLCKETRACIIISTHTRKPDDGSHPHKISEYDVKGSGAIPQSCHNNILFSRDKLAEDEYERNSVRIRVPKLRRTGQTGEGGWAHFDTITGRLEKGQDPSMRKVEETNDF